MTKGNKIIFQNGQVYISF